MALLCLVSLVTASCPFSGYVPGMKSVVISKWEDINATFCWGICPSKLIEEQSAWIEINTTETIGTMLTTEEQFYEDYATNLVIKAFLNLPRFLLS